MAHRAQLKVINDETGDVLEFEGTITDDVGSLFEQYLSNLDRLLEVQLARDGVPFRYSFLIHEGQLEVTEYDVPSSHNLSAMLHRLRPFILTKEPASYDRVTGAIKRAVPHEYIRKLLKQERELYDGRRNQALVKLTSNDVLLNSEEVLKDWLNAYEYHQDPGKREKLESLHRLMPLEHTLPFFLGLLGGKLRAIENVACIIQLLSGKRPTLQLERRG